MILLPAIDLMSGEVVRLRQGKPELKTVYSKDPAAIAQRWAIRWSRESLTKWHLFVTIT